jgi:hypothetical protein
MNTVTRISSARKWRMRFVAHRLAGLLDEPRPGRPRTVSDEQVEAVITRTLETTPADAMHWSTRSLAQELGMSQSAVSRIWRAFGLAPHKQDFWTSADPLFVKKVRDIVGLYLNPPERALVLCVDDKTQIQALNRKHLPAFDPASIFDTDVVSALEGGACRPVVSAERSSMSTGFSSIHHMNVRGENRCGS